MHMNTHTPTELKGTLQLHYGTRYSIRRIDERGLSGNKIPIFDAGVSLSVCCIYHFYIIHDNASIHTVISHSSSGLKTGADGRRQLVNQVQHFPKIGLIPNYINQLIIRTISSSNQKVFL